MLLCTFLVADLTANAQEICNNGVDDDGDGLVDLHDPDCQCHFTVTNDLLRNSSFELYNHCPLTYTYNSNYDIANFWQFGTYTIESDYYHHMDCSYDWWLIMQHMAPHLPLPDGKGIISVLNSSYIDPIPENEMVKSYMGQCLQSPLTAGEQYTLSFYAGRFRSWDNFTGKIFPFTVALFGNTDCNAVPFGKSNVFGNGCPSNYPGWVLLGKTVVTSVRKWTQARINFTAPADIHVIEIGPDCSILPPIINLTDSTTFMDYHIYYLDDLHLLRTNDFPFEYIHGQTGSGCSGHGRVLEAPLLPNATYQWYKDSVAIPGATGITYQVPDGYATNYYNASISTPANCIITEPFLVTPGVLGQINIPTDTILCANTPLVLAPAIDGVTFTVNGAISTDVAIHTAGNYSITATDNVGCQRTFNVHVAEQKCSDCEPLMPNAFTPNGDGLNDIFKARLFCNPSEYDLQIFDRWGEKVFESHNGNAGWDGTYLGNKVPADVYVYVIKYKTVSRGAKTKRGSIVLIR